MANYEIHIQDVENIADPLVLHYAERDAIELNWLGGDSKTQPIVGSELNFSLEAGDARDAAFIELFTLDEKRWKVSLRISESQELVWQGYVLPESYQEPYNSAIFYVSVSSVDGLGLLKGVKLPDDFYNDEKSVMQVLCAILKLTKVDLEIFFSPAIVNANEKDWNKLLVDTLLFDKNKDNAYKLLKDLLESMRCQIFQAEGRWYIEGFNKQQLLKVTYDVYTVEGDYLRTQEIEKTIKQIPFLANPDVRMVPGIREAVVTYERNDLSFPDDFIQENDVPWVIYPGQVDDKWLPKHWFYTQIENVFIATADRDLVYMKSELAEFSALRNIKSRKKYFVKENSTIKFKLKVKVWKIEGYADFNITDEVVRNWSSQLHYDILINDQVILTNRNSDEQSQTYLEYDESGNAEVELTIRPENDGLLNVKFYAPYGDVVNTIYPGAQLKELSIEKVPETKDDVYVIENTGLGSNISELDIRFGDDPTLLTEAFYIQNTRKLVGVIEQNRFWFEVKYYNVNNGITYAVVPLRAAVMAFRLRHEHNKIFHVNGPTAVTGQIINNPEIIFNYEDGESAVIVVNEELANGYITCNYSKYVEETKSRNRLTEWSDAVIDLDKKRFGQVVGEIEKRIYESPHFSFEGSTDTPVKYNDIIKFNYFGEPRFFTISKCNWRPDSNTSDIIMNEMLYEGGSTEILPPFVDAGPDITLSENDLGAFLSAAAAAPSGFIETVQWTQVAGPTDAIIEEPNSLQTSVSDTRGEFYTFRITVTDSNGQTAFDEVNVSRETNSILILNELESLTDSTQGTLDEKSKKFELLINPALSINTSLALIFDVYFKISTTYEQMVGAFGHVKISKNNVLIFDYAINAGDRTGVDYIKTFEDVAISLNSTDSIIIEIFSQCVSGYPSGTNLINELSRITFKNANYTNSDDVVTNLPVVEELYTEL